tara:strand:+ start:2013 stop:2888 length:876 start_codon:yes stop_codon:yes gene_type:complete
MTNSIGVLLAGGTGSRLYPITKSTNKHLLPVHSKPLIYYSLTTLMLAGNREVALITNPKDIQSFKNLLGNGSNFGIEITYVEQDEPKGLSHALYQAKNVVKNKNINLILGDNIFYGKDLKNYLLKAKTKSPNCLFTQDVNDSSRFGVLRRDKNNKPLEIIEKPKIPPSSEAVLGLYFYENNVFDLIENIKPSERGEIEISSLNNLLLKNENVHIQNIGRGINWFDAGNVEDLFEASNFINSIEKRQNNLIASIEEVSYTNGWISKFEFEQIINTIEDSTYGQSLLAKYFNS